jgi:lipid-A-disaccharide synthase
MKILISAGEASGDRYAAELVEALRARIPDAEFFGCAGPCLREIGVRPVMRAEELEGLNKPIRTEFQLGLPSPIE